MMRWKGGLADDSPSPGTAGNWSMLKVSAVPGVTSSLKTTAGCCLASSVPDGGPGSGVGIAGMTTTGESGRSCGGLGVVSTHT